MLTSAKVAGGSMAAVAGVASVKLGQEGAVRFPDDQHAPLKPGACRWPPFVSFDGYHRRIGDSFPRKPVQF